MGQTQSLQSFTVVENLEKGPNVAVQTEKEVSLAQTPLPENFTAIEMQEQAEETDEDLEQGQTVAVQAGIEEEKSTPILQKFTGEKSYILN